MTKKSALTVRSANSADAKTLANLAGQLGYPSTDEQILKRFDNLEARSDENAVYVADLDGHVVGWVHVHIYNLLVDDPEAEIGGLVVDENVRGQRIGEALMQAAEIWARQRGCASVYLRSNTIRTQAHEFYKRLGYTIVKSQYAFRKNLEL